MLVDLTLGAFADEVAGPSPAPGGGSVAAYAGCIAASLAGMVCHLSIGKKGIETSAERLRGIQSALEQSGAKLLAAVDADTDAYLQVADAYRLPKDTPDDKAARSQAVAAATLHAADVPLATAESCLEVLELVSRVSERFNTAAASDLGVAVQCAMTGVRGASLNVAINLQYLDETSAAQGLRERIAEVERRAEELYATTWPLVRDLAAGTTS